MQTLKEFITQSINFESDVIDFIKEQLSDNELANVNYGYSPDTNRNVSFDLFLQNGCTKLNIPPNTAIEIKNRLTYDIFNQLVKFCNENDFFKQGYNLWIITSTPYSTAFISGNSYHLKIISFKSFIERSEIKVGRIRVKPLEDKEIIERAKIALEKKSVTLFLGAGVSKDAGAPTWKELLEQLRVNSKLPSLDEFDDIVKGRIIANNNTSIVKAVKQIIYNSISSSKLIDSVANMVVKKQNVVSVINFNYDDLVEQRIDVLSNRQKCFSVSGKPYYVPSNCTPVFHVHGYIPQTGKIPEKIVLGEKEYHELYQDVYNWGNIEQLHALSSNTCLFIGLSMSDPNLRRLLDSAINGQPTEMNHFAFLKKDEHEVDMMKQTMRDFGIYCIWYDDYTDLPIILDELSK